ncbi:Tolllike receptor 7, partial [Caligus rogercresseyi]
FLNKLRFFLPEPALMTFQRNVTLRNGSAKQSSFPLLHWRKSIPTRAYQRTSNLSGLPFITHWR